MKNIFENIRIARKAAKKSQQEMADILKVNRSTYSNWELNTIPDVLTLIEIGKVLNVDWTSLVKETITGEAIKPGNENIKTIMENTEAIKENTEAILKAIEDLKKK